MIVQDQRLLFAIGITGKGGRWKEIEVDEDGWNGHKNHPNDFLVDANNPCPPSATETSVPPTDTLLPTEETEIPTETMVPTEITEAPTDVTIEPTEIVTSTPEETTPAPTFIPTLSIPESPETPQIAPVTGKGNIFVDFILWIMNLFA